MERGFHHTTRSDPYIAATVGSAGTAAGFLGPCPEGYCWYFERTTSHSNTANATTGLLELYVQPTDTAPNDTSRQGRQGVIKGANVQDGEQDYRSPIYVGPGMFLLAAWSALTNGDKVSLSAQLRVHKIDLQAQGIGRPGHVLEHVPVPSELDATAIVTGDQVAAV